MDVHASPAELPELHAFLGAFQVRSRRPEGREALERDTTGLRTELPHKNGDTIAQAVPGTSAQRWQEFLTNMPWDKEDLNRQRVQKMVVEAARSCPSSVRLMHGVLSKPVCVRKMILSAGLKWGGHRFTQLRMMVC
jgi:hypothetical protein